MSLNTLETARSNGEVIDASHINEITLALIGAFVGRNATGVPTPYQSLGTKLVPWGDLYARQLVIDGTILDPAKITSRPNRIISGRTRTTSLQADFLRANGLALSFKILANDKDLFLSINDNAVTVDEDITVTGVIAAPAANNTCQVNELTIPSPIFTAVTGGEYLGEDGDYIELDSMGSAVTAKIGQIVAFRASYNDGAVTHTEIMYGYLESGTRLKNVFRGFFFDKNGDPIKRSNYVGNDSILTLMSLGWVFLDVNATTVEVSYKTPTYAATAPGTPATGDYWFDQANDVWKRYNGSGWIAINRTLIGWVVADSTACIAARSFDFDLNYEETNTLILEKGTAFVVQAQSTINRVSVNGNVFEYNANILKFDLEKILLEVPTPTNPNDLAVGEVFLYIKQTGELVATTIKPYDRREDLKGFYHPWESWRCVGKAFIATDPAVTALGILRSTSSYIYNPELPSPIAVLELTKPNGTNGGAASAGGDNITFNEFSDPDGALMSIDNNGGSTAVNFGRGVYEIELQAAGVSVGYHRVIVADFLHGQITAVGIMSDASFYQSIATVNKTVNVRSQSITPSIVHQCASGFGNGYGLAMSAGIKETYAQLKIRKIK